MKTIKQTMALAIATGISVFSFAQVNLGLQSTTSAAVRAAVSAATIKSTTAALNSATRSSLQTSTATTGQLISQTAAELREAGDQTVTLAHSLKNNVMNTAAVNANTVIKASAQNSTGADQNIHLNASVRTEADGKVAGEQANNTAVSALSKANAKTQSGLETATNKIGTTTADTKSAVTNTKPAINGSASATASEKSVATISNR